MAIGQTNGSVPVTQDPLYWRDIKNMLAKADRRTYAEQLALTLVGHEFTYSEACEHIPWRELSDLFEQTELTHLTDPVDRERAAETITFFELGLALGRLMERSTRKGRRAKKAGVTQSLLEYLRNSKNEKAPGNKPICREGDAARAPFGEANQAAVAKNRSKGKVR